jgi:hypothetical protein
VATAGAGVPGPLTIVQRSGGFHRLYLSADPATGTELAIAAPGIDEACLISDLITAIRGQAGSGTRHWRPAVACFHVGITRLVDDRFRGGGANRVLSLCRHPAILRACPVLLPDASPTLAVVITAGLFEELRPEGLPGHDWRHVPVADAWLTLFST